MDETQKLPVHDELLSSGGSGRGAEDRFTASGSHRRRQKRPRDRVSPSKLLGVPEEEEECSERRTGTGDGGAAPSWSKASRVDHKALAALLAAQPRTLKQPEEEEENSGTADLDSDNRRDDIRVSEEGDEDDAISAQPLLGMDSESGESPAKAKTHDSTPRASTDARPHRSSHSGEGREQVPDRASSTAAPAKKRDITGFSSTAAEEQASREPTRQSEPPDVPSHTNTKAYLTNSSSRSGDHGGSADDAGDPAKPASSAHGDSWVQLLRSHQHRSTEGAKKPSQRRRRDSSPSSSLPVKAASAAEAPAPSRTAAPTSTSPAAVNSFGRQAEALERTGTSLEVARSPGVHTAPTRSPAGPSPAEQPVHPTCHESDAESPVIIPRTHASPQPGPASSDGAEGEPGASTRRQRLAALTPSLAHGAERTCLSPASGGTSPQTLDLAQTLAVYDLSLKPEDDDDDDDAKPEDGPGEAKQCLPISCCSTVHPASASKEREGPREDLVGGAVDSQQPALAETLDDGFYKEGGVGQPEEESDAVPDPRYGEEGDPTVAGSVPAAAATDTDEETPLFAAVAPPSMTANCQAAPMDAAEKRGDSASGTAAVAHATEGPSHVESSSLRADSRRTRKANSATAARSNPRGRTPPPPLALGSGIRVEARWGALWYDAVTTEKARNGYVQIRWIEDGSVMHVKMRDVRLPKVAAAPQVSSPPGVHARLKNGLRLPSGPLADTADHSTTAATRPADGLLDDDGNEDMLMTDPRVSREHGKGGHAPGVAVMTATQLVQLMDVEDEIEAQTYTPPPPPRRSSRSEQPPGPCLPQSARTPTAQAEPSKAEEPRGEHWGKEALQQPPRQRQQCAESDSQKPLLTAAVSPDRQRLFVATQKLLDAGMNNGAAESGGRGNAASNATKPLLEGISPLVKQSDDANHRGLADESGGYRSAAQVRRRLAQSATPSSVPALPQPASLPSSQRLGFSRNEEDVKGGSGNVSNVSANNAVSGDNAAQTAPPPLPQVSVGEDYYFRMMMHPLTRPGSAPVAPAVLLGRVIGVEEPVEGGACPRVALQMYEMKHITMRQNPHTGELEQQTTVYLGPRQAVVMASALLFDIPVFVLSPAALRHVYVLEEADPVASAATGVETQQMGSAQDEQSRSSLLSSSSTESYDANGGSDFGFRAEHREHSSSPPQSSPNRRTAAPPPMSRQPPPPPPPQQQLYGNTFPLPTPRRQHPRRAHGISLSAPLHPRTGSVLEEVIALQDRPVRAGMIVAFRNPYALHSTLSLTRVNASAATPPPSPTPCERQGREVTSEVACGAHQNEEGSAVDDRTGVTEQTEEEEAVVLYGKVQMMREVNGGAVLVVHTMAHNSVFGGSKMYVITPDMILDVA